MIDYVTKSQEIGTIEINQVESRWAITDKDEINRKISHSVNQALKALNQSLCSQEGKDGTQLYELVTNFCTKDLHPGNLYLDISNYYKTFSNKHHVEKNHSTILRAIYQNVIKLDLQFFEKKNDTAAQLFAQYVAYQVSKALLPESFEIYIKLNLIDPQSLNKADIDVKKYDE